MSHLLAAFATASVAFSSNAYERFRHKISRKASILVPYLYPFRIKQVEEGGGGGKGVRFAIRQPW